MKMKLLVHAIVSQYGEKKVTYSTYQCDMSEYGCGKPFQEIEVEFDEPEYADVVAGTISVLREKQADIRAKAELEINKIEHNIQNILCIENSIEVDHAE